MAALQIELDTIVQKANENMIDLDSDKSKLLVIGGGHKKKVNTSGLSITIKENTIVPSPAVRWLGVWLDSQLNFKQHVQE